MLLGEKISKVKLKKQVFGKVFCFVTWENTFSFIFVNKAHEFVIIVDRNSLSCVLLFVKQDAFSLQHLSYIKLSLT